MMIFIILLVIASIFFILLGKGLLSLLKYEIKRKSRLVWENVNDVPMKVEKYTPQGMTFAGNMLLLANSWKDTKSRVYELNSNNGMVLRYFDMPEDAVHTSGLAYDSEYLWAVDYRSNLAYCLDIEQSFKKQSAVLIGSFKTGLKGTSGCAIIKHDSKQFLAISDFMNSRKTVIVDMQKSLEAGTCKDSIIFSYKNENFSQGIVQIGKYLLESENKIGIDIINVMDLELLQKTEDARKSTVYQINAPWKGVEDLSWDGEYLWTSDENSFLIYKLKLNESIIKLNMHAN